ncbi:T9SS type A sorting domain-containing protein [Ferruginibacter sp. HRS2-29]|uniref:T9SS type A sorting domain-containing protein n=1 Tax=Ferruginibacter sp. HRS2-29 TaxID=2487334 RepID=UPI0020CC142B|nr:T9SS type A sorting domain-containing protein [Ferruginibacter sp. HRS2-29]MCP9750354.1 T9SS C-terminal target domain-containing protein [Ferruginibacter sp. HRS2-29]
MLTKFTTRAMSLFVALACLATTTNAQQTGIGNPYAVNAYQQVYSGVFKGGTAVIGNTNMTSGVDGVAAMNNINGGDNRGVGYTIYGNDNQAMDFVDIDGVAITQNSSSANLSLPAGSNTIKFARLYWGGRIERSAVVSKPDTLRKVKIRFGNGAYNNVTAPAANVDQYGLQATGGDWAYQTWTDVTAFVQGSGAGTYTVADVPASQTTNGTGGRYAGWSIVIAYENPNSLLNSVRVYHGFYQIASTNNDPKNISVTLNGLNVPNNSLASTDAVMSVMGWEGDGHLGATGNNPQGDYIKVNNVVVSNATNLATNFWNGSITKNGAYVTTKNPNYANQMGIDIDEVNVGTGFGIQPNATSVTVTFGTEQDQYFPSYFAFALRVKDPLVTIDKTVADASGNNLIESNEILTYTLTGTNVGPGVAKGVFVVDSLPTNVTYIPNSMEVISGTGMTIGAQTDAVDAADKSFKAVNGTRNYVKFFIGTNSTNAAGGTLQVGQGYNVRFKVQGQAIPGSVTNTATSYAFSEINELFTDVSTAVISPSGGPLSVKLVSFTGVLNNNKTATLLNWITESELNNKAFEVQRSEDAVHFTTRTTVGGNGTTGTRHSYSYTDALNTNAKVVYYRLKVIDNDGKVSYSNVVAVKLDGSAFSVEKMSVYPNPFVSDVKVFINSKQQVTANFRVVGLDGRQISTRKVAIETGDNIVVMSDLQNLPKGTYILEISSGDEKYIKKIIKN